MTTNSMRMKSEIEILKQTWATLWKPNKKTQKSGH